jgi:hypothetical protein
MDDSEMFMNFYDPHSNSPFYGMMASLIFTHKDQFYQALYEAISKHPSYVVLSDLESDKKIKVLDGMIEYYEARESYEKCATLLNIKKEIETYVEN